MSALSSTSSDSRSRRIGGKIGGIVSGIVGFIATLSVIWTLVFVGGKRVYMEEGIIRFGARPEVRDAASIVEEAMGSVIVSCIIIVLFFNLVVVGANIGASLGGVVGRRISSLPSPKSND